jgi:predicted PurR-regulated permease PerM
LDALGPAVAARPKRPITSTATPWIIAAIVIGTLYVARSIFVCLTLAIFLSFVLAPVAAGFRKMKINRKVAVLLAMALALGGIGSVGTVLVSQAATFADDAPSYVVRLSQKSMNVRDAIISRVGLLTRTSPGTVKARRHAEPRAATPSPIETPKSGMVPVEVHEPPLSPVAQVGEMVAPLLSPVETAAVVLVLTVFILFQKEDLRDRLIRLMGTADLHRSTRALNDAAARLSRYFLAQLLVNAAFGAMIWVGLLGIGIPSPALWGILAGLLRFVPYIGTILAAALPLALAAAVAPGWSMVGYVALLFGILEPLVGYAIEPFIYGRSTGLSPVAVVVAALFWTWLWGPVGLILSMPLTLMLVVLGRHVPVFGIFDVLLGDRPALSPAEAFYQRILAGHPDEAIDDAEDLLTEMPLASYFDDVVLPGLRLAIADLDRGAVSRASLKTACEAAMTIVAGSIAFNRTLHAGRADSVESLELSLPQDGPTVVCFPARGPLDPVVAAMTVHMLTEGGATVRKIMRGATDYAHLAEFDPSGFDALCIIGLFDARGCERILKILPVLGRSERDANVFVGVDRTPDAEPDTPSLSINIHKSVGALCAAILS